MAKKNNKDKKKNNKLILFIIGALILIAAVVGIFAFQELKAKEKEISYDQLYQDIVHHQVEKIENIKILMMKKLQI